VFLAALLAPPLLACGRLEYEYEHEFWLRVDGSGTVYVTGRPALWAAFKGVGGGADPASAATPEAARALLESSGLEVRRVRLTRRGGRAYIFAAADFDDVNRLTGTPAFPDLTMRLAREGERLRLRGAWSSPPAARAVPPEDSEGLMAVRFHLPSKIYEHASAAGGVERGNIVSWRQGVREGLDGRALAFGATMDRRSILGATVALFAGAIALALLLLAGALYLAFRRGGALTVSARPPTGSPRPPSPSAPGES
jgi:hypothetical protein